MNQDKLKLFSFGWLKLIGFYSIILFLVDFANRTGKWWFHLIAIWLIFVTIGAIIGAMNELKKKESKNSLIKTKEKKNENNRRTKTKD